MVSPPAPDALVWGDPVRISEEQGHFLFAAWWPSSTDRRAAQMFDEDSKFRFFRPERVRPPHKRLPAWVSEWRRTHIEWEKEEEHD